MEKRIPIRNEKSKDRFCDLIVDEDGTERLESKYGREKRTILVSELFRKVKEIRTQ